MTRTALLVLAALVSTGGLAFADDSPGGKGWKKIKAQPGLLPAELELHGFAPGIEHEIDEDSLTVYGSKITVERAGRGWKISRDGAPLKAERFPLLVTLGTRAAPRAILIHDRGSRLSWTSHWGARLTLGRTTWWLVDADADGTLWQRERDAILTPTSHTASLFVGQAWSEKAVWTIGADASGQAWSRPATEPRARKGHPINDAWRLFNSARQSAGLRPVEWDRASARGCRAHVDYCERNAVRAIREDESKPGYTEEGAEAGANSVGSWLYATPREAVLEMLSTAFNLSCLFTPSLARCAMAHSNRSFCFDVNSDRSGDDHEGAVSWVWPAHGARDLVLGFNDNGEVPMPVPGKELEHEQSIGHAVIAQVDGEATGYQLSLTTSKGAKITGHLTSPARGVRHPAVRNNKDLVIFVPSRPLPPKTTFVATLRMTYSDDSDERVVSRVWRFTTGTVRHRVLCPLKSIRGKGRKGGSRRRGK